MTNKPRVSGEAQSKHTAVQQCIPDDYAVLEEIASEALLMLQDMNQPNIPDADIDDEYALPVGTEKLPDLIKEMNQERGIDTVVNYDAEIPEDMRLQPEKTTDNTQDADDDENKDKEEGSDETIIYDPDKVNIETGNNGDKEDNNEDLENHPGVH